MRFRWEYREIDARWDLMGPWESHDGRLDWESLIITWAHITPLEGGKCMAFEHDLNAEPVVFEHIHEAKAYLEALMVMSL